MKHLLAPLCAALVVCAAAFVPAIAQDKAAAPRTLKVKLNYTGTGTVDDKHHIFVFLFDSPGFVRGEGMPIGSQSATSKDAVVTFSDTGKSPVYVATVYDPTGGYDGQSGPPPAGSSLGMYSKNPGDPAAIDIEAGKSADVQVTFDDTSKMQ